MKRTILVFSFLLLACQAQAVISLTNAKGQTSNCGGSATCATTAFANPLTNGSVIVACAIDGTGSTTITWTDTATNAYNDSGAGAVLFNGSGNTIRCGCTNNTHTTASNIVTAHEAGSSDLFWNVAAEFTGTNGCTADKTGTNANATNTTASNGITTGSVTPSQTGDLILGYAATGSTVPTAGTSPNVFTSVFTGGPVLEYLVYGSTSAINPTMSDSNTSDPYGGITVALKVAGGGAAHYMPPAIY